MTFLSGSPRRWGVASAALALGLGLAGAAQAQAPSPTPSPPARLFQDELDLQANANVVQGSGARAFGMGGAFLARADDATAASWNPAGLSYLRAPELSFVWTHNQLGDERRDSTGQLVENDQGSAGAPDFLAFTYPFEMGSVSGAAQLSFQRVLSQDSDRTIVETALPATSPPTPPRVRAVNSSGGFDVIALGSGWQLSRGLRLGMTLNHWFNGYDRVVEVPAPREIPTRQNSRFRISGWNFHFGAIWSPWQSLNVGAVFKTAFTANVALERSRIDFFEAEDGTQIQTTNAYAGNDLRLDFPWATGAGLSWRPRSNLTLSVDYTRTRWSTGKIYNFFTLPRTEVDQEPPIPHFPKDYFPELPYPTLDDPHQQDSNQLRAGFEYVVIWKRLKWPIRAGYFGDDQYFRAVGGAPRFRGLTVGTGLIIGPTLLDVAYVRETGSYTSLDGLQHDVRANRVYASLIYRHRRKP